MLLFYVILNQTNLICCYTHVGLSSCRLPDIIHCRINWVRYLIRSFGNVLFCKTRIHNSNSILGDLFLLFLIQMRLQERYVTELNSCNKKIYFNQNGKLIYGGILLPHTFKFIYDNMPHTHVLLLTCDLFMSKRNRNMLTCII